MGPVVSALLAVGFFVLGLLLGPIVEPIAATFSYLAIANLLLLVFNLVPGFPLDGGRILRALLWWLTGNQRRATTIASVVGQVVAFGLIFWGISRLLSGDIFGGIWTAFIGWFLFNAAAEARRGAAQQDTLAGLIVGQIAQEVPPIVAPETPLRVLARDRIMAHRAARLPRPGRRSPPRPRHPHRPDAPRAGGVGDADGARRDDRRRASPHRHPADPARRGAANLRAQRLSPVAGARRGRPVGLLSRSALIRFLQLRQQLGNPPPDRPRPRPIPPHPRPCQPAATERGPAARNPDSHRSSRQQHPIPVGVIPLDFGDYATQVFPGRHDPIGAVDEAGPVIENPAIGEEVDAQCSTRAPYDNVIAALRLSPGRIWANGSGAGYARRSAVTFRWRFRSPRARARRDDRRNRGR